MGTLFLPMHLPVLLGGFLLGPLFGGTVGLLTPLVSCLLDVYKRQIPTCRPRCSRFSRPSSRSCGPSPPPRAGSLPTPATMSRAARWSCLSLIHIFLRGRHVHGRPDAHGVSRVDGGQYRSLVLSLQQLNGRAAAPPAGSEKETTTVSGAQMGLASAESRGAGSCNGASSRKAAMSQRVYIHWARARRRKNPVSYTHLAPSSAAASYSAAGTD